MKKAMSGRNLVTICLSVSVCLIAAAAATDNLRTVTLSLPPLSGEPVGRWDGNALLNIQDFYSTRPILHVMGPSGDEIQRFEFHIPRAELVKVLSNRFSRHSSGYVAVGGTAYGDSRGAGFLAILATDGVNQRIVRTEPYVPYALEFSSDGIVWVAGLENDSNANDKGTADYWMVRRFDRTGRLLGGSFSRKEIPLPYTPIDDSIIVTSKDRVGWFIPRIHRYVEFSSDGRKISDLEVSDDHLRIEGVALCEDNRLWASFHDADRSAVKMLDRTTGKWSLQFTRRPFLFLYGCVNNSLVATSDWSRLNWISSR